MIIDTIDKLASYAGINPLFGKVAEFLKGHDLNLVEDGKYELEGKDLFVNIVTTKGKTKEQAVLETHRKMIDIQIPLSAAETFGYTPLCDLPEAEYNEAKDITKYEGPAQTYVTCKPGQMAIFFTQDGHAPCITSAESIRKAIFKVKE
ncbi:MAG: YhcH/YjgK/YiaL family protein [Bacteroidaceae bacterium]|nr:YhcH/YjgK/YiaL family protein [Bacteroidaceae bacterium]